MTGGEGRPTGPWSDRGLVMLAAGLVLLLVSNLVDIVRVHAALTGSQAQIDAAVAASGKAESQLNALAAGTASLARGGNANAAAVIATMRRNGVNIAEGAGAAVPPATATP